MTKLYGISNCDTVKKARAWMDAQQLDYHFHDFRVDGVSELQIRGWIEVLGWESVVNKRSTTWRELDDATKAAMDSSRAVSEILKTPTLVKRPVLEHSDMLHVGFATKAYENIFL